MRRSSRARARWLLVGLLACVACGEEAPQTPQPAHEPATRVGGEVCAGCHAPEAERWRGSHHDLAMQEASEETVLGDFDAPALDHRGEIFEFQRRDDRFFVRTAGANGEPADFEVAYTFGVVPLQQYLVRLPGGRLHALAAAWDSRPAADGGQRWFHLYPDESVPPGDALHWTGLAGSWNVMCAECHSTNLSKGYRLEQEAYETTWSEIDVSCEACHGPGSSHADWAERGADPAVVDRGLVVNLRNDGAWSFVAESSIARRVPPRESDAELEVCAPCHSRRSQIVAAPAAGGRFLDAYRPAFLEEGLYYADGQILDEVYVWGSFVQSRMHAAGVVCSECHDPHALRIEAPDAVCGRCHRPDAYATPAHHHHRADSAGASCVACHMPSRLYMVVDARRDHGFRVPRPDLSEKIGVPNACTGCHLDQPASWAAEAAARWYGPGRAATTHPGEILDAGRRGAVGSAQALAGLCGDPDQPAIVRASALRLLGRQLGPDTVDRVFDGLEDPSPLVRVAAIEAAEALPPADRRLALEPLLRDPTRVVRIEAARVLAPLEPPGPGAPADAALERALAEYRAAQFANADRPEAHVNLGIVHAQRGELEEAEREYARAMRLGPFFLPAYVNLADVYRQQERDEEGEDLLRRALVKVPGSPEVQHALGLVLLRQKRPEEALEPLRLAAELAPGSPRYAYVYGVALHSLGKSRRALAVLEESHRINPTAPDLLVALATMHRDRGDTEAALGYARRLLALRPQDPRALSLVRDLGATGP